MTGIGELGPSTGPGACGRAGQVAVRCLLMADDVILAWRALRSAHELVATAVDADLAAAGKVTLAAYELLAALDAADGRSLRMQELAPAAAMSRSRASRLVDALEAEGLVARQADPHDGRVTFAHLTTEGRRTLRGATAAYRAAVNRHLGQHLRPAERAAVARGLGRVTA